MIINNYNTPQISAYPVFTGKPMTVSREEIQACLDAGMRNVDIANNFGKSRGWVNWIFNKFGIQEPVVKTRFRMKKEAQAEQMLDGIRNGLSVDEIAKNLNMSTPSVRNLKKYVHPKTLEIAVAQGRLNSLLKQLSDADKIGENLQSSISKLYETPRSVKKPKMKEEILSLAEELERSIHQTCKDIKDKLNKI